MGATSEDLVQATKQNLFEKVRSWKTTPGAATFMDATDVNQLSFTWEALYQDGTTIRQFDDINFIRALQDEDFVPPQDQIVSTDRLDKKQVVEFLLYPIAFTRKRCPWYENVYRVILRPEQGERIICKWLTDFEPNSGYKVRRHVLGIAHVDAEENPTNKVFLVLSPSGAVTITASEDVSFEGE